MYLSATSVCSSEIARNRMHIAHCRPVYIQHRSPCSLILTRVGAPVGMLTPPAPHPPYSILSDFDVDLGQDALAIRC